VRAARDDFEDRKAAHYGAFVVNYVFSPEVTGADARTMLRLAERLNWRQWVILEWVRRNACAPIEDNPTRSQASAAARRDFQDLVALDLLDLNSGGGVGRRPTLTAMGESIARLLGLDTLDHAEVRELMVDVEIGIKANPPGEYVTSG
jgi:hypothetical protein